MEKVSYEDLINYLKDNIDILEEMVNEVYAYAVKNKGKNSCLERYHWEINGDEFYNIFFKDNMEIARAVFYGGNNYNYMDEYVRFDAYGNLETTNDFEMRRNLYDGAEEILDEFLELYADNNVDISDETFKGMISDYYNEDLIYNKESGEYEEREEDK